MIFRCPNRSSLRCMVCCGALLLLAPSTSTLPAQKKAVTEREIAARVGGKPIYARSVNAQLLDLIPQWNKEAARYQELRRALLVKTIDRYLALEYLHQIKVGASRDDMQLAMIRLEKRLKLKQQTLADYLKQQQISRSELEHRLDWQISWNRYLNEYLTEENFRSFFDGTPSLFDGTQIRVSQILLKSDLKNQSQQQQVLEHARQLREKIKADQVTFASIAKMESISPTANTGGIVGWIEYRGSMPPEFTAVAFKLKAGEISEPLVSQFGVHIIRCDEIKKGTKTWQQARPELRKAMIEQLFRFLVTSRRSYLSTEKLLDMHIEIKKGWQ